MIRNGQSLRTTAFTLKRSIATSSTAYKAPDFYRPGPPPLPAEDQREFEELVRKAQAPLAKQSGGSSPLLDQDAKTFSADGAFRRSNVSIREGI